MATRKKPVVKDQKSIYSSLVAKIMSILKLDDAGKVSKFFDREVKIFKRLIVQIEANIKTSEIQHNIDNVASDEKIEDALEAVENAYMAVRLDEIEDNAAMELFRDSYWDKITNAEKSLKYLIERKKVSQEIYDKDKVDAKEMIIKYKARINKIS